MYAAIFSFPILPAIENVFPDRGKWTSCTYISVQPASRQTLTFGTLTDSCCSCAPTMPPRWPTAPATWRGHTDSRAQGRRRPRSHRPPPPAAAVAVGPPRHGPSAAVRVVGCGNAAAWPMARQAARDGQLDRRHAGAGGGRVVGGRVADCCAAAAAGAGAAAAAAAGVDASGGVCAVAGAGAVVVSVDVDLRAVWRERADIVDVLF